MKEKNQKKDCVFCKIVKGEIPCYKIYEDDKTLAFLDINPYVKGHLLIIPKKHCRWIWDMNDKDYIYLKEKAKKLAKILRKTFNTKWIEEVIVGIGVPHTHIHLLPRKENDGLGKIPKKPLKPKPSDSEMKKIAEKIREFVD